MALDVKSVLEEALALPEAERALVAAGESVGIDYETAQRLLDEELARG